MHHEGKSTNAYNKLLMTKALSKAIMQRTRFRNKFLKNPTYQNS